MVLRACTRTRDCEVPHEHKIFHKSSSKDLDSGKMESTDYAGYADFEILAELGEAV
jgi:hypothetical protein